MTAVTNSNSSRLITDLNQFISSPPNPISYTLLRNIHDFVWPDLQPDLHDTYSVISALARVTNTQPLMTWSMSRDMRCTGCGNLFVSRFNGAIEVSVPSYSRTNSGDPYPVEELLENLFRRTISRRAFCPDCGRVDDTFTATRINEFSNIMVLNIGGGGHPLVQEITIPFDLDMSRFAVGGSGAFSRSLLQYRLAAIIFAGEPATAFVRNGTNGNDGWISVSEFSATTMSDFEDIHYESYISSNARTLVYERLDDI